MAAFKKTISLRSQSADEESASVNMIPLLNLFTVLVPFLLTSVVFLQIHFLHLYLPVEASGEQDAQTAAQKTPPLNLVIRVSHQSFSLEAARPIKHTGPIARTGGERLVADSLFIVHILELEDFATLVDYLREIKEAYPEEYSVTIMAQHDIRYNTLIAVMDCARLDNRFSVISFSEWER